MSIKKAGKMPAYLSLRPFSSTILKTLISLLSPLPFLFFSVTCSHYKCFLLDFPPLLFLLLFFFFFWNHLNLVPRLECNGFYLQIAGDCLQVLILRQVVFVARYLGCDAARNPGLLKWE